MKILKSITLFTFLIYQYTLHSQNFKPDVFWEPDHLKSMMDTIVEKNMKKYFVTGTTYTIVKDNKKLLTDGKGFSDIEKKLPMDPHKTKFMLGSISKLITTTAAMQLVEKGMVDLHADIETYLKDFDFPHKITLHHLLTHTSGLEEKLIGRIRKDEKNVISLEEYLLQNMPKQIIAPGKIGCYSNHGMALVGLIIQRVSGMPFEAYVKKNIFDPLEMDNSYFSLNKESIKNLAVPYRIKNNKPEKTHYEYVQTIAASMLVATAPDMANFMMAHLNKGKFNDNRVLNPETTDLIHSQQFTHNNMLAGRGYGFFESSYRGKRALTHGNTRNGFISYLYIIPEEKLGIFVTINGGKSSFRHQIIFDLLKHIYPKKKINNQFSSVEKGILKSYEGVYYSSRKNESTLEKLITQAYTGKIEVKSLGDTALFLFGEKFKMVKEDVFKEVKSNYTIAFGKDDSGNIQNLFLPGRSDAYIKNSLIENLTLTLSLFIISFLTFIIFTIKGLIIIIKKNWPGLIPLQKVIYISSIINLIFLVSFSSVLYFTGEDLQYYLPKSLYLILTLPLLGIVMLTYLIVLFPKYLKTISLGQKLAYSLFLIISAIFFIELYYWNFLGYHF